MSLTIEDVEAALRLTGGDVDAAVASILASAKSSPPPLKVPNDVNDQIIDYIIAKYMIWDQKSPTAIAAAIHPIHKDIFEPFDTGIYPYSTVPVMLNRLRNRRQTTAFKKLKDPKSYIEKLDKITEDTKELIDHTLRKVESVGKVEKKKKSKKTEKKIIRRATIKEPFIEGASLPEIIDVDYDPTDIPSSELPKDVKEAIEEQAGKLVQTYFEEKETDIPQSAILKTLDQLWTKYPEIPKSDIEKYFDNAIHEDDEEIEDEKDEDEYDPEWIDDSGPTGKTQLDEDYGPLLTEVFQTTNGKTFHVITSLLTDNIMGFMIPPDLKMPDFGSRITEGFETSDDPGQEITVMEPRTRGIP